MNFEQLEHEHVAHAWERMKLMLRNCPTHGLKLWMIIQNFYAGLNFSSRNLLDSAAGGTFMEITLGASVSTIPKSLCDVLGLTDFEECSLNLHLADSTIKRPMG
jgi:hypothetical protein